MQKNKRIIITEGGAQGHCAHLTDDGDLTFGDLKEIFKQILSGKIEMTEKVDGFAFAITMKNGRVYSARNKSELKDPLDFEQTLEKFSSRTAAVKNAYQTSMKDMANALGQLSSEEQKEIFEDGKNYLAFEIVSQDAKNLIDYGNKATIILHGINEYDDNWRLLGIDSAKGNKLYSFLKQRDVLNQETYEIRQPVALKLKNRNAAQAALPEIISIIDQLKKPGNDNTTLRQYVINTVSPEVKESLKTEFGISSPDVLNHIAVGIISRCQSNFGDKRMSKRELAVLITKYGDPGKINDGSYSKIGERIDAAVANTETRIRKAMAPISDLVIKAGGVLIESLSGFLAVNPSETSQALSKELDGILDKIDKAGGNAGNLGFSEKELLVIANSLEKLNAYNKKIYGTEGVVFTYNGKMYKLTSTFGPLNQLIGLFRRKETGSIGDQSIEESTKSTTDPNDTDESIDPVDVEEQNDDIDAVLYDTKSGIGNRPVHVFFPGSFKPPHKGHVEVVKDIFNKFGNNISTFAIFISNPKKAVRKLDDGQIISAKSAKEALEFLLSKSGISSDKIEVKISKSPSPFTSIGKDFELNAENYVGGVIALAGSFKDNEAGRYKDLIDFIIETSYDYGYMDDPKTMISVLDPSVTLTKPIKNDGQIISATDIRDVLSDLVGKPKTSAKAIVNALRPFLPDGLSDYDILTYFDLLDILP
jgi:hypothetical protein